MKSRDPFVGKPRILEYRTDDKSDFVAFPITPRSRGIDVFATLLYLNPHIEEVHEYIGRVLTHAVDRLGLMNNRHLPLPRTAIRVSDQLQLVEHVHFGSNTTVSDVDMAIVFASGEENLKAERARLTAALIDTGALAGFVIEVVQNNEFACATDETVRQELLELTKHHYDL